MKKTCRQILHHAAPAFIVAIAFLVGWDLIIRTFEIKKFIAPSPWEMGSAIIGDRQILVFAFALTGTAAIAGLIASIVFGVFISIIFSRSAWVRNGLYPYAVLLQTVPVVAIAPILVIWIGNGIASVIAVAFILSLFPIITNTTTGLLSVTPEFRELFQINAASRLQTFCKLELPFALPYLMAGIKISGGLAVIGAIVGEFFVGYGGNAKGLGFLIRQSVEMNRTERLFAVVLLSTLLGMLIFWTTNWLANTVLRRWCAIS